MTAQETDRPIRPTCGRDTFPPPRRWNGRWVLLWVACMAPPQPTPQITCEKGMCCVLTATASTQNHQPAPNSAPAKLGPHRLPCSRLRGHQAAQRGKFSPELRGQAARLKIEPPFLLSRMTRQGAATSRRSRRRCASG